MLKLEGDRKPRPFLQTPFNEGGAIFSPDGRWLAYQSDESGRNEIYVASFPDAAKKWQISIGGGTEPLWGRNGRELFYRDGDKMMAADVTTKPPFAAGKPKPLFKGNFVANPFSFWPNYDVSPDSQRFLMLQATEQEQAASQINIVLNWSEELKEKFPQRRSESSVVGNCISLVGQILKKRDSERNVPVFCTAWRDQGK